MKVFVKRHILAIIKDERDVDGIRIDHDPHNNDQQSGKVMNESTQGRSMSRAGGRKMILIGSVLRLQSYSNREGKSATIASRKPLKQSDLVDLSTPMLSLRPDDFSAIH